VSSIRHRPYLALYEQTLTKLVSDIANEFTGPEKQDYVNAALRFRIPYWDWASDSSLPDVVASQGTIQVTTPQGNQTIPNPLYCYTFNPLPADFGSGLPDEQVVWNLHSE
jgi:tyrosinase